MQKQNVFRFEYSGEHVRCVRQSKERPPGLASKLAPWLVIALGVLACFGWWSLW